LDTRAASYSTPRAGVGISEWMQAEDLFEAGKPYRFILDLAAMLGKEAEVTARIVWKRQIVRACVTREPCLFTAALAGLGPNEDDESRPRGPRLRQREWMIWPTNL
jgi:hypothetical protein